MVNTFTLHNSDQSSDANKPLVSHNVSIRHPTMYKYFVQFTLVMDHYPFMNRIHPLYSLKPPSPDLYLEGYNLSLANSLSKSQIISIVQYSSILVIIRQQFCCYFLFKAITFNCYSRQSNSYQVKDRAIYLGRHLNQYIKFTDMNKQFIHEGSWPHHLQYVQGTCFSTVICKLHLVATNCLFKRPNIF